MILMWNVCTGVMRCQLWLLFNAAVTHNTRWSMVELKKESCIMY
jgi:hypothetical protein